MEPNIPNEIPSVTFKTRVRDESIGGENPYKWQDVTSEELFKGKRIALFSLPGAFTPICSADHLPAYEKKYEELKELGIDDVYCIAVNDAFVMNAWAKKLGIEKVKMIPDGSGKFTEGMGMLVKKDNLGYGNRSWRYSAVINDGEVEKAFIEKGKSDNCEDDPFEVSDVDTMIAYLKENK